MKRSAVVLACAIMLPSLAVASEKIDPPRPPEVVCAGIFQGKPFSVYSGDYNWRVQSDGQAYFVRMRPRGFLHLGLGYHIITPTADGKRAVYSTGEDFADLYCYRPSEETPHEEARNLTE